MNTSAVVLDIESGTVGGEIRLPIDRLAFRFHRKITAASAVRSQRDWLRRYAQAHIHVKGVDGRPWKVALTDGRIERNQSVQDLAFDLTMTPPAGKVTDFDLRYDVIIDRLVTHRAFATIR